MPYSKTTWTTTTPINTTNLQKIEDGIATAQSTAEGKEPAFTKNTGFNKNLGTIAGTVAEGKQLRIFAEQTDFETFKTGKDAEGIFTTVEYKRSDGTLAVKSVLSGGTTPQYTTRTITYYGTNGTTVEKTTTLALTYDADGDLISEA